MTEIGMALSNPLEGQRYPGCVGRPLPRVEVRLMDENGPGPTPAPQVKSRSGGPRSFSEYWGKPEATREAFRDGWFRTGDVAVEENGIYRILGRSSVDIIKAGGTRSLPWKSRRSSGPTLTLTKLQWWGCGPGVGRAGGGRPGAAGRRQPRHQSPEGLGQGAPGHLQGTPGGRRPPGVAQKRHGQGFQTGPQKDCCRGAKITKSRGGSHQSPKTPKPLNKKGWQSPDCQPFQILVD